MYVARILYPVKVLGPGNRVGIWFSGCSHLCKGCSNPELHDFDERYSISLSNLKKLIYEIINNNSVDGFTITGGDPFEQPEDLSELLDYLNTISEDILVYTGYTYEDIEKKYKDILKKISVLIDGEYIEELNEHEALRGSTNQRIIILKDNEKELYESLLSKNEGMVQNFYSNNSAISVGIHRPGYEKEIDKTLLGKGLIHYE